MQCAMRGKGFKIFRSENKDDRGLAGQRNVSNNVSEMLVDGKSIRTTTSQKFPVPKVSLDQSKGLLKWLKEKL